MANAFERKLTRLFKQPHMGDQFSIGGMTLTVDKDGGYDVPGEFVPAMLSHGFTRSPVTAEQALLANEEAQLAAARELIAKHEAKEAANQKQAGRR